MSIDLAQMWKELLAAARDVPELLVGRDMDGLTDAQFALKSAKGTETQTINAVGKRGEA